MTAKDQEQGEIRIAEASPQLAQGDAPRQQRKRCSNRSSTVRLRWPTPTSRMFRRSCSRRSPATSSATRAPPGGAREGAWACAEPERLLFPFLYDPAPDLLDLRHQPSLGTALAALIAEILDVLVAPARSQGARPPRPQGLREPLSHAEARVLRYLPTKLSAPEIMRTRCTCR